MEETKTLVTLSIKENVNVNQFESREFLLNRRVESKMEGFIDYPLYKFSLKFYKQNLNSLFGLKKEVILDSNAFYRYQGEDLLIKSLYLNASKKQFVLFLFYIDNIDGSSYLAFDLFEINILNYKNGENIIKSQNSISSQSSINMYMGELTNDFIKINNQKVVFMYLSQSNNQLVILLINVDLYNAGLYPKEMYIDLHNYIPTQIKGLAYNDYLLFSATGIFENELDYILNDFTNYLSIFMAFGYGNGTDDTINITKFLNKEKLDVEDSFIYYLYKNFKIENNILGYMPSGEIRLVSFPKELSIFLYDYEKGEEINLSDVNLFQELYPETLNPNSIFNSIFVFSECIYAKIIYNKDLENCPDYDYIIRENKNLIKNSQYYYIDFQHFLIDASRNQNPRPVVPDTKKKGTKRNLNFDDIYPGRINRIKFKLCYEYCETCYELGTSDNEQNCKSCLPKYQYDYLYFTNTDGNPDICVPEGSYYIKGINVLANCRDNFRFYVIQQIIREFVFQTMKMNIHAHLLIQSLIRNQKNVFIVILKDLKMMNAQQKI